MPPLFRALIAVVALLPIHSAFAQDDGMKDGIPQPSIATSLPGNADPFGTRKTLADRGIAYSFIYTNDVLSNLRGGLRRGTIDQGKLEGILNVDLEKLAGWSGLKFFANGFYIHNTGRIRRDYVGGINTIAAIEAHPTVRLSEIWLEQQLAGGPLSVRIGQLAADAEFFFSDLSTLFLQSDWPTIAAVNLPSGGAAYPLSTPGIRLKAEASNDVTLLLAVLNGDPAGPGPGDEQLRNRYGLNFRVNDPAFVIGEAQIRANQGAQDTGLARAVKFGGWTHLGRFNDYRFDNIGLPLADPASSGTPARHHGNWGLYAILDQQLYRLPGGGPDSGVSVFARVSASPSDRSLVSLYADGGIVFRGLIPGRPNDAFGASMIYAQFSNGVRGFDRDLAQLAGGGIVRDYEANLEFTYRAEIVPGWTVQPNLQFIWHPGGDASRDATVIGARTMARF
jgi:porin